MRRMTQEERTMAQALRLAARGLGATAPNPAVGCVIVDEAGRVAGCGWTQSGGRPHAEAVALAEAGGRAQGGTAYVSLEPCAHRGETPPCAEALIEAGIRRVVYAHDDPDPRVAGRGAEMLKAAGVAVEAGVLETEARRLNLGFILRITQDRPMLTLKLAAARNGFMRTPEGASPWITGREARCHGHMLRARHDAILTGSGTLAADNPSLDCRIAGLEAASPLPVIMSRSGDIAPDCKLAARGGLLFTENAAAQIGKLETLHLPELTPAAVLAALAARGITRVLLESGATLARAFLDAELVDAVALFRAPHDVALDGTDDLTPMKLDARFVSDPPRRVGVDTLTHMHKAEAA